MPNSRDLDSQSKQPSPSWTLLDLDGLVDAYWDVVAPAMRADGMDPQIERPTHEWLSSNGFRGLTYSLREYHDMSFGEFWSDILELEDQGYDWDIDHEQTIDALERYLDRQQQRLSWSDRTVETHRTRLNKYAAVYGKVNDTDDLLTPVARDSAVPASEAVDACWDTFDKLDHDVSRTTLHRIYKTVSNWYSMLVSRRQAALNPTEGLDYDWSDDNHDGPENPPLEPKHVRSLYNAADTARDRLIVVALCAWGLRSSEVAALHVRQLVLDDDQPRIEFAERKNGPGTVAVIYGADVAKDRIAELSSDDWNGYLFPSKRSQSGHRTRGTILDWFQNLAETAGLPEEIGGSKPQPQMGRRFWYDRYSSTLEELIEHQIQEIAEEQGSASADVVWSNYLSEERRRELRRQLMREKLSEAFDAL
ncbi:tyrosine-type recombinase/integrase [Halomicrobium salinisoli]|uniref:tyrosine-type recombinase/integrase n=1 Tax=Halomicrobium salinisoli TaxID=2878391 RepID=UPI001CEFD7D9|nr:tyrosine-type recombinase/integrase [Halomicrobium salinisoli]